MAELLLKIGSVGISQAHYQDGDIVAAFNQVRISHVHAQHICLPRNLAGAKPVNAEGFRDDLTGLARTYFDTVYQYRFERVSRTEVKRILLSDLSEQVFGPTPDADGKAIDVPAFVARRLDYAKRASTKGAGKALFGTLGAEAWYGGRTMVDAARLVTIWDAIEARTSQRLVDHFFFPLGRLDFRHFLALQVDDFTTAEGLTLVSTEADESDPDTVVLKRKRRHHVVWQTLGLSRSVQDIEDRAKSIDVRQGKLHLRSVVVQQKPLLP